MALKASEISQLIKERIENFEAAAEARDVGTVIALTDGIVRIHGLAEVMQGEMIEFPGDTFGLALNLERDSVGAVSSMRSATRSTARAPSTPKAGRRSRRSRPGSSPASPSTSLCRPA